MKISSTENIDLHGKLFKNWDNYDKWAPFLKEFQQQYKYKCNGIIPALLGVDMLFVNDELKEEFLEWVNQKIK
jgi:hypothetical protein